MERPATTGTTADAAAPAAEAEAEGEGRAAGRRDGIDVARILALLLVVLGHLLLAVVDRRHGEVRGANLLALHPGWALVAVAAPMPVFFAAGGWANATSTLAAAAPRLRTLVGLGTVAVGAWSLAVLGTTLLNEGDSGIVGDGARVATQPVWFLAAYVPFAAAGGTLARLARHLRVVLPAVLVTLLALDVARFGLDAPGWIGWPGFFLAWGTPWLLGAWWRHRVETAAAAGTGSGSDSGFDERATGWALAVGGTVACIGLVHLAGYAPALIDAVPGARSNTTPPTLYTALAGVAQVGLLLVCAPALDRAGRRWRRFWSQAGEAAVGVYVWHLTALTLCVAAIAAGFPVPDRLTWLWWLTRPLWWAAILAVTAGFVGLTAVVRSRQRGRHPEPAPSPSPGPGTGTGTVAVVLGVAVTSTGAALVGLRGPRHAEMAVLCSALFGAGWLLLGSGRGVGAGLRRAGR